MKAVLNNRVEHEMLSLMCNIAYACVPAWYGAVRRNLEMDIVAPKEREGHARLPLIIWICGGGFRCVSRSTWMPQIMEFAKRGYVVASIEYRTANDATLPDAYADVKSAIRYLKAHAAHYCIDPKRIAVMGESGGGTLASFAGTTGGLPAFEKGDFTEYDSRVNAVVDFYGIADFNHNPVLVDGRDVPPFLVEDALGLNYTEADAARASAISYISSDTPPFLIFHGNRDNRVPIEQSERLYRALTQAGVRVDFYEVDGGGHGDACFYQPDKLDIIDRFLREVL